MNKQNREFQAIIGHLLDLYRICSFQFSNPHSYTKFRAIKSLQERTESDVFIETGTYLGVTTNRCSPLFKEIYTVELDKKLANKAKSFLSRNKNTEVLEGDALEQLPKLLKREHVKNVLIFLDGHFSGRDTACGNLPEPAIEELKIIAQHKDKINAVLIDDFRLFGKEPGFPNKSTLFKVIEDYLPEFDVSVYLDQISLLRRDKAKLGS